MSTKTSNPQKTEGTTANRPTDTQYIGTDATGAEHYYSRIAHTVWVEGEETKEIDLTETPIETVGQWRDHVVTRRGDWQVCLVGLEPLHEEISKVLEVLDD